MRSARMVTLPGNGAGGRSRSRPPAWLLVLQDLDVAEPGPTENRIVDDPFHVRLDDVDAVEVVERDIRRVLVENRFRLLVHRRPLLLVGQADGVADRLVELVIFPVRV